MTLILDGTAWEELFQQFPGSYPPDLILDDFETVESFPACLGRGYTRSMELLPGMWLDVFDRTLYQDWIFRSSVCDHAVQYSVLLTGFIHHEDTYPTLGGQRSYVSGSGISPSYTAKYERSQRLAGVSIHLLPAVMEEFLMEMPDSPRSLLKVLLKNV
ncbi:hypothetical protein [Thermocoleostomius sinensis]|uniref:Uncharacterized protein n=1 Tax=Thermocoleostomius sinensis A174 TaxID=2016057 RepID=A0A9E8Z9J0_9CYAN|nr:hypothetical protein [Thermocoleostomius sinensis]WAL58806.1 hypothetical protein OXH18_16710 [Thermocoleostomius sinensis A174]